MAERAAPAVKSLPQERNLVPRAQPSVSSLRSKPGLRKTDLLHCHKPSTATCDASPTGLGRSEPASHGACRVSAEKKEGRGRQQRPIEMIEAWPFDGGQLLDGGLPEPGKFRERQEKLFIAKKQPETVHRDVGDFSRRNVRARHR